jgi:hypothetical protein
VVSRGKIVGQNRTVVDGIAKAPLTSAVSKVQTNGTPAPAPSEAVKKVLAKRQGKIEAASKKSHDLYASAKSAVSRITDEAMRKSVMID